MAPKPGKIAKTERQLDKCDVIPRACLDQAQYVHGPAPNRPAGRLEGTEASKNAMPVRSFLYRRGNDHE
jgi:hypothetical protein